MAGSFEDLETKAGELEGVAVFHGDEFVLGLSLRAEMDGCVAVVAELEVSGEKVGVEVSEEDVADLNA